MDIEQINLRLNQLFRISTELQTVGDENISYYNEKIAYNARFIWRLINDESHPYQQLNRLENLLQAIMARLSKEPIQ